ncbi:MAG: hypothetical protein ACP5IL_14295 [Syntrophobacteraceae bacterium]
MKCNYIIGPYREACLRQEARIVPQCARDKVARTIADLDGKEEMGKDHLMETMR